MSNTMHLFSVVYLVDKDINEAVYRRYVEGILCGCSPEEEFPGDQ